MNSAQKLDLQNLEVAFSSKSDQELKRAIRLFRLMNNAFLVKCGILLCRFALFIGLPMKGLIRATIYDQFCGGETLEEAEIIFKRLADSNLKCMIDYAVEGSVTEEAFEKTKSEIIRDVEYAANKPYVPIVAIKLTGLADPKWCKRFHSDNLTTEDQENYDRVLKRLDEICAAASKSGVQVYFDAEESWTQDTIDRLVEEMIFKHNKENAVVFNTLQMYRHDRFAYLKKLHEKGREHSVIIGVKLVRGAYMEKERKVAKKKNVPSPIQANKEATDLDYNNAFSYCLDHLDSIAVCMATHNERSIIIAEEEIQNKNIDQSHPHIMFAQLYGMGDMIFIFKSYLPPGI